LTVRKYTVSRKKTCRFVFDDNSGVFGAIVTLFVDVEAGMNIVQCAYLKA